MMTKKSNDNISPREFTDTLCRYVASMPAFYIRCDQNGKMINGSNQCCDVSIILFITLVTLADFSTCCFTCG